MRWVDSEPNAWRSSEDAASTTVEGPLALLASGAVGGVWAEEEEEEGETGAEASSD